MGRLLIIEDHTLINDTVLKAYLGAAIALRAMEHLEGNGVAQQGSVNFVKFAQSDACRILEHCDVVADSQRSARTALGRRLNEQKIIKILEKAHKAVDDIFREEFPE